MTLSKLKPLTHKNISLKSSHNAFYKNISSNFANTSIHMSSNILGGLNKKISTTVTSTSHKELNINSKRFMQSSSRQLLHKSIKNSANVIAFKPYATNRIFTPKPTTSSNESLNNNPAIPFARRNKPSTVVQHPEWVVKTCKIPRCNDKLCLNLCGEKKIQNL